MSKPVLTRSDILAFVAASGGTLMRVRLADIDRVEIVAEQGEDGTGGFIATVNRTEAECLLVALQAALAGAGAAAPGRSG